MSLVHSWSWFPKDYFLYSVLSNLQRFLPILISWCPTFDFTEKIEEMKGEIPSTCMLTLLELLSLLSPAPHSPTFLLLSRPHLFIVGHFSSSKLLDWCIVRLGCYNKISQSGWFIRRNFSQSGSRKFEIRAPDLFYEGPLLGHRFSPFILTRQKGQGNSLKRLLKRH